MPWKVEDLTGQRFGRLVVREQGPPKMYGKSMNKRTTWICDCDCGGEATVLATSLKNGMTKSCGCLFKDAITGVRKKNKFDLSGEYGIGYIDTGECFYFDKEDYDKIKDTHWYLQNGYVYGVFRKNEKQIKRALHRIILNVPDNMIVDHIGGSETIRDNRKSNLRIVTKRQNQINHKLYGHNKSGVTGVYWVTQAQKWEAVVTVEGKKVRLGQYKNKEDAIRARKEGEKRYYKEYSYDQSQKIYKGGA